MSIIPPGVQLDTTSQPIYEQNHLRLIIVLINNQTHIGILDEIAFIFLLSLTFLESRPKTKRENERKRKRKRERGREKERKRKRWPETKRFAGNQIPGSACGLLLMDFTTTGCPSKYISTLDKFDFHLIEFYILYSIFNIGKI